MIILSEADSGVNMKEANPALHILSSGFHNYPEAVQEAVKLLPAEIPARRLGTESEVSAAVLFLLSPAAAYISGETIRVDGSMSLYRHSYILPEREPMPSFEGFHLAADLPGALSE